MPEIEIYQIYGILSPVLKCLKVHWHGWYVHSVFTNPQKQKFIGVRLGELGGHGMLPPPQPIHLPGKFQLPCDIPVIVGWGPILLKHCVIYSMTSNAAEETFILRLP
jgi:hypothetical protein